MDRRDRATMTRRRLVAGTAGLTTAGAALATAGCTVGGQSTAPETGPQRAARPAKLSWMATGGAARVELHRKQIARFEELTGHDVELVVVTGNYEEKLFADLAAGSAGDVMRLESAYIPGLATPGRRSRMRCGASSTRARRRSRGVRGRSASLRRHSRSGRSANHPRIRTPWPRARPT